MRWLARLVTAVVVLGPACTEASAPIEPITAMVGAPSPQGEVLTVPLPAALAVALAVSPSGVVVGTVGLPLRAVIWRDEIAEVLPSPVGTVRASAYDVSADGRTVAGLEGSPAQEQAVLWIDGARVPLGLPAGTTTCQSLVRLDARGRVAAQCRLAQPPGSQANVTRVYLWEDGAWIEPLGDEFAASSLADMTEAGVIVGLVEHGSPPVVEGFRWEAGSVELCPGLRPWALNARGQLLATDLQSLTVGLWFNGSFEPVPLLLPTDLSNSGLSVGLAVFQGGYQAVSVRRGVQSVLQAPPGHSSCLPQAVGLSGLVVGSCNSAGGPHAVQWHLGKSP